MWVLKRRGRSYHDAAADLCKMLVDFCRMDRRDRIALRNEVDKRSWDFDWTRLGRAYHTTHELAIARIRAEQTLSVQGGKASGLASLGAVTADDLSKMSAGQSAAIAKVSEDVKLPSGKGARA
jgi:hypothetical protein